jgi:hypothetical protein
MSARFSRRAFGRSGATVALAAGTASVAIASPESDTAAAAPDDSEIFALEREFDAAVARFRIASDIHEAAEARCGDPGPPVQIEPPEEYKQLYRGMNMREFETLQKYEPEHPLIVWDRENRANNAELWVARMDQLERAYAENGCHETHAQWSAALGAANEVGDRIMACRARSIEGMRVKVRVYQEWFEENESDTDTQTALASLAADLEAMGGGNG